jgi:uncharacterized protein (TIGR01777 family)
LTKNILITGGSGLIGTRLTALLLEKGYKVTHLSRAPHEVNAQTFFWNIDKRQVSKEALQTPDTIIHLAGAGIGDKRWTKERKNEILNSRINSTRLLYEELKKGNHNVKTFISASGIDYYDSKDNETLFTENGRKGSGFLADVVGQWEEAADEISTLGIRVVKIRTGLVLSKHGGALKEMMRPVKLYVGAPLGAGAQFLSWIHLDDLCRIYIRTVLDETMHGTYNAVAPNPVTNKEFTRILADTLHRPIILPPIPGFVLKFLFGEMADLVLNGAKVSSQKIQAIGFEFKFDNVEDALKDLLSKN